MNQNDVRELQQALRTLGFSQVGAADGLVGNRTNGAVDALLQDERFADIAQNLNNAGPDANRLEQVLAAIKPLAMRELAQRVANGETLNRTDARSLQDYLRDQGVTGANGQPLDVDGRIGTQTRGAVNQFLASRDATDTSPLSAPLTRTEIQHLQGGLNVLMEDGQTPLAIDGVFGSRTSAALAQVLQENGQNLAVAPTAAALETVRGLGLSDDARARLQTLAETGTDQATRTAQAALNLHGMETRIDGVAGPETRGNLNQFIANHTVSTPEPQRPEPQRPEPQRPEPQRIDAVPVQEAEIITPVTDIPRAENVAAEPVMAAPVETVIAETVIAETVIPETIEPEQAQPSPLAQFNEMAAPLQPLSPDAFEARIEGVVQNITAEPLQPLPSEAFDARAQDWVETVTLAPEPVFEDHRAFSFSTTAMNGLEHDGRALGIAHGLQELGQDKLLSLEDAAQFYNEAGGYAATNFADYVAAHHIDTQETYDVFDRRQMSALMVDLSAYAHGVAPRELNNAATMNAQHIAMRATNIIDAEPVINPELPFSYRDGAYSENGADDLLYNHSRTNEEIIYTAEHLREMGADGPVTLRQALEFYHEAGGMAPERIDEHLQKYGLDGAQNFDMDDTRQLNGLLKHMAAYTHGVGPDSADLMRFAIPINITTDHLRIVGHYPGQEIVQEPVMIEMPTQAPQPATENNISGFPNFPEGSLGHLVSGGNANDARNYLIDSVKDMDMGGGVSLEEAMRVYQIAAMSQEALEDDSAMDALTSARFDNKTRYDTNDPDHMQNLLAKMEQTIAPSTANDVSARKDGLASHFDQAASANAAHDIAPADQRTEAKIAVQPASPSF